MMAQRRGACEGWAAASFSAGGWPPVSGSRQVKRRPSARPIRATCRLIEIFDMSVFLAVPFAICLPGNTRFIRVCQWPAATSHCTGAAFTARGAWEPDTMRRLAWPFAGEPTMAAAKWNEAGRVWEEDHGLLDEEQVTQCARADV